MKDNQNADYRPALRYGVRVRLLNKNHHEYFKTAKLLDALPNPSGRQENQWYDVHFDDGIYGRFPGRDLEPVEELADKISKKDGDPAAAA